MAGKSPSKHSRQTGGGAESPSESSSPDKRKQKMTPSGSLERLKPASEKGDGKKEDRRGKNKSPERRGERADRDEKEEGKKKKDRRGASRDESVSALPRASRQPIPPRTATPTGTPAVDQKVTAARARKRRRLHRLVARVPEFRAALV